MNGSTIASTSTSTSTLTSTLPETVSVTPSRKRARIDASESPSTQRSPRPPRDRTVSAPHVPSDPPNYQLRYTLKGHKKPLSAVRFSHDGQWLATASSDVSIHLHRLPSFDLHRTLTSHSAGLSDLAFSSDSRFLASASDDKTIRIWDLTTPFLSEPPAEVGRNREEERAQRVLHGHLSAVFCVAWNPRGDLVASGGMDETVRVWDVQKGTCMKVLPAHSDPVSSVQFNMDGTIIVSCSWDGYIRIWDTATGQCLKTLVNDDNTPVSHVSFTPNAKFIFTSTLDSQIRLWDYQNDLTLKTYSGHVNRKYCIPLTLDASGKCIITGSEDHQVVVWDLQTREVLQSWESHKDVVIGVASHPTRRILASAGLEKDPTVKIWYDVNVEEDDEHPEISPLSSPGVLTPAHPTTTEVDKPGSPVVEEANRPISAHSPELGVVSTPNT